MNIRSRKIRPILAAFISLTMGPGISYAQVKSNPPIELRKPPMMAQTARISMEAAKEKVIGELFHGDIGKRAMFANPRQVSRGATIKGWRSPDTLQVAHDGWFFFVDDQPGANWEHAAHYVVVNSETGALQRVPVKTPPADLHLLQALNPAAEHQMQIIQRNRTSLKEVPSLSRFVIPARAKYAVLLSGGWDASHNYSRYWNDLSFIYSTLKRKYGYTDDEIIVLFANGTHLPNGDLDGDGKDDIKYAATKANLSLVFDTVAKYLREDGKFFFYSTNHGGQGSGPQDAVLYLWGDWITDADFATLSKKIVAKESIYVMEQCFSGGMMDNLLAAASHPCTKPSLCAMTAANSSEPSWAADSEGDYDEYVYHWVSAINGRTPSGTPVNADTNGDGIVSMSEAHAYALSHDNQNEHPQIGTCVVRGCDTDLRAEVGFKDDCVSFNPATTSVANIGGTWKIVDGTHYMFDFGSNKANADQALAIIKHYKMTQSCFVGRPHPPFSYLLVQGAAPSGPAPNEDCLSFNPATTTVSNASGTWRIVDGNHSLFDFGTSKANADQAMEVIHKHGFTYSCFVGRPNPHFQYLRK